MFLQGKTWVMDIIRELLAWLDYIVYSIIKWILYKLDEGVFREVMVMREDAGGRMD